MSTITITAPRSLRTTTSQATPRTRLRMTRRGRVVLTTLVALPLVSAIAFASLSGGLAVASGSGSAQPVEFASVVVAPGDTLWAIAGRVAPKEDPRDVIDDIVHLNNLQSSDVQAGQALAIPTKYAAGN